MGTANHFTERNDVPSKSPAIVVSCPICAHAGSVAHELPGWGSWCICSNCELQFADPMKLPEKPTEMFDKAYRGQFHESNMEEFAYRMTIRHAHLEDPKLWFFSPYAIDEILKWLKARLKPGATVFELGCGLGLFLHTLKREGYNPVGLDVAKVVVDLVRSEGFKVWHGALETVPDDFVEPQAIVSLFMIHHLVDPMGFFRFLRSRYPNASVAIAEYGKGKLRPTDAFPPRTLTRWNAKSLVTALSLAGYETSFIGVRSTGSETRPIELLRTTVRGPIAKSATIYRFARKIQRRVLPKIMRPFQQEDYTILALGTPRPPASYKVPVGAL